MMHVRSLITRLFVLTGCILSLSGMMSPATAADADPVPFEAIQDSAKSVMDQGDFRSVRRRVLEQLPAEEMDNGFLESIIESIGSAISDFFSWLFTPSAPQRPRKTGASPAPTSTSRSSFDDIDFTRVVTILLILVIAAVLIWIISRIVRQHQQDPERGSIPSIGETALQVVTPPGELAASTYESRAMQFAEQGDFASGIRELLLGSMSWIERAGLIRFRQGLTNRDYIRAVWRQEERCTAYQTTGSEFELVYFGRRRATEEMFHRCLTAFQGAFREEAATARDEG